MIGATLEEIARYLGCSHDTIERRFRDEVAEGRADGAIAAKVQPDSALTDDSQKKTTRGINRTTHRRSRTALGTLAQLRSPSYATEANREARTT
jgi:hypothetical protein